MIQTISQYTKQTLYWIMIKRAEREEIADKKVGYLMYAMNLIPQCPVAIELLALLCFDIGHRDSALFYLTLVSKIRGGRDQLSDQLHGMLLDLESPLDAKWLPESECIVIDC
jgi:hypothetical protein